MGGGGTQLEILYVKLCSGFDSVIKRQSFSSRKTESRVRAPSQQRLDDEDAEAVTLTMSRGSTSDFNKREECVREIFFARPVVVPFTRPVTAPACEYLDCASIKMTPPSPSFIRPAEKKNIF